MKACGIFKAPIPAKRSARETCFITFTGCCIPLSTGNGMQMPAETVLRVITVSLETFKSVKSLPTLVKDELN